MDGQHALAEVEEDLLVTARENLVHNQSDLVTAQLTCRAAMCIQKAHHGLYLVGGIAWKCVL